MTSIVRSIESKSDLKLVERVITTLYNVIKGVDVIVTDEVTTHYTATDTLLPGSVETKRLSAEKDDPNGRDPDDLLNVEKIANEIKQARIVTRNNANGAVTGIGPDAPTEEGTFPDGYRHFEINSENCYLIKESKEGRNYYFYAQKRPGKTTLMAYFGDIPENVKSLSIKQLKEVYKPKTLNIDINHQAFSDNFPPAYPGKCIADGVKTYRELAEDLNFTGYADSIAWANNADADSVPSAGTEITIPTMITEVPETAFNGSLPAIEMLLGSMYPALAMPHISIKPPKVNWALIAAEVAVAAAIIYFSGGALSGPVAEALGSQIAGTAVAYGVAGMAGNAASQGIAIAAHQQHGFNVQAMATQGLASAVSGGFIGATSSAGSAGTAGTAGAATSAAETGSASAALSVTWGDVAMNIATAEAVAAAQQGALMAAGLQSKPDWKGFAIAAFNGAVDLSVNAAFGEGMIASATYTGITLTGDTLIRGEPVNGAVLSATAVGSMVGNYAGQQAKQAYLQSQPKADAKQARKQKPAAESGRVNARAAQQRPLTVQDKQMQAAESIVDGQQALPDPVLDTGGASYQLSEMNRTRLQRWNNSLGKSSQPGSAAAELFRAAQVAGNGESYSFLDDASTMEKAAIYGAGAALALAALPEAAAGAAISLTAGALESLGYISMASVGIPMAESMLATEAATAVGGATLTSGASLAGKAYNNAARFFGRGGAGGEGYGSQFLNHSAIKFSQTSVNNVNAITESMNANGWKGAPIDVVKLPDGTLVSVDNTRLLAASRANIPVKADIHDFNKPLTQELAERFTTKQGGVPNTWGEAMQNRIGKQNNIYRDTYPNGSYITGAK